MHPAPKILSCALLLASLAACSDRNDHALDTIPLSPEQEREVFVAPDPLGPEANVLVVASVPKMRYENGVIVLTGGKQVYVVQPSAWRAANGTAISQEAADRAAQRSAQLDLALQDVAAAAADLRTYLEGRAREASTESERMHARDQAWRSDQERQTQSVIEEASRLRRSREEEMVHIDQDRDRRVAEIYKDGSDAADRITTAFTNEAREIDQRSAAHEARAEDAKRDRMAELMKAQGVVHDVALAKHQGQAYMTSLDESQMGERAKLEKDHAAVIAALHAKRDEELTAARNRSGAALEDARRLAEEKAERVRREAESRKAEIRARLGSDATRLPAAPATAPAAPATPPAAPAQEAPDATR